MGEINKEVHQKQWYIKKVHRQHHSLVVVIPKKMANDMGIKAGDYVSFRYNEAKQNAQFDLEQKGVNYGLRCSRSRGRENSGG